MVLCNGKYAGLGRLARGCLFFQDPSGGGTITNVALRIWRQAEVLQNAIHTQMIAAVPPGIIVLIQLSPYRWILIVLAAGVVELMTIAICILKRTTVLALELPPSPQFLPRSGTSVSNLNSTETESAMGRTILLRANMMVAIAVLAPAPSAISARRT